MIAAMKLFAVLVIMNVLKLVTSDSVTVHVVSNQDSKGGNCLMINYSYVCSDKLKTYFDNVNIKSWFQVESDDIYGLGFSNSCSAAWTNLWTFRIKWSKITKQQNVWFHDDQCFWTTKNNDGQILKDNAKTRLCLKDQISKAEKLRYANPFKKGTDGEEEVCIVIYNTALPGGTTDQQTIDSEVPNFEEEGALQAASFQLPESSQDQNSEVPSTSPSSESSPVFQPSSLTSNENGLFAQGPNNIEPISGDTFTNENEAIPSPSDFSSQNSGISDSAPVINDNTETINQDNYQDPGLQKRRGKRNVRAQMYMDRRRRETA